MCDFSIILLLREIMTFYSRSVHAFYWIKISTLIKAKQNRKWKTPHTFLEGQTLCFSSYKNHQFKVKLYWVEARQIQKRAFFYCCIFSEENFFNICFGSMYSVLNTLSKYTYFYLSENIISYSFLLVFEMV